MVIVWTRNFYNLRSKNSKFPPFYLKIVFSFFAAFKYNSGPPIDGMWFVERNWWFDWLLNRRTATSSSMVYVCTTQERAPSKSAGLRFSTFCRPLSSPLWLNVKGFAYSLNCFHFVTLTPALFAHVYSSSTCPWKRWNEMFGGFHCGGLHQVDGNHM